MKRLLAVLAVGMLALAGCAPEPEPEPTPEPTTVETTPEPTPEPTAEPLPPATWPLLGTEQGVPGETPIVQPVIGVKIENSSPARPWVGLTQADVVFVEMVEAGMTRFHALYNSTFPEEVGPVRSLRPMDAAILGQWHGTLIASGGQQPFIDRVESAVGLRTFDRGDAGFYRAGGRRAPHNVFYTLEAQVAAAGVPSEVPPLATFGEPRVDGAVPASSIRAAYPGATSTWTWNESAWERSDNGSPSVEADGTRVTATNVLVLRVQTQNTGLYDPAGAPVPETILSGSGELSYFWNGQMTTGTWSKGGDNDPLQLTGADGQPLVLAPGHTWIELLPAQGTLSWQ